MSAAFDFDAIKAPALSQQDLDRLNTQDQAVRNHVTGQTRYLSAVQVAVLVAASRDPQRRLIETPDGSFTPYAYLQRYGATEPAAHPFEGDGLCMGSGQPDTFGAYAPDPDADFAAGVAHGRRLHAEEPSPIAWFPPRPPSRVYQAVKGLLVLAALGALLWLAVS